MDIENYIGSHLDQSLQQPDLSHFEKTGEIVLQENEFVLQDDKIGVRDAIEESPGPFSQAESSPDAKIGSGEDL